MRLRTCHRVAATVLLSLLLVPAAHAATVFEQSFTCPVGGETFKQSMAGSGTSFGQFFDLKPYGAIAAPWPLAVCPGNGFVIFKRDYSDAEIAQLTRVVEGDAYRALVAAGDTAYYRAAVLMAAIDIPVSARADTLLKATWQADGERYARYAAEALGAFEQQCAESRKEGAKPSIEGVQCGMLVGELQRRLGRFDAARATFKAVRAQHARVAFESPRLKAYLLAVLDAQDALVAERSLRTSRLSDEQMRALPDGR